MNRRRQTTRHRTLINDIDTNSTNCNGTRTILITFTCIIVIIIIYAQFSNIFLSPHSMKIFTTTTNSKINLWNRRSGQTVEETEWCNNIFRSYENNKYGMTHKDKQFASQYHQDWFVYSTMFQYMHKQNQSGFYIDLASNDYKDISNSYFFDKCLFWNGICIEPQERYHQNITLYRNCKLIDQCIWSEPKQMIFEKTITGNAGLSGLKGYNKMAHVNPKIASIEQSITMDCITLQTLIEQFDVQHIDYLSLDVEGAEVHVLKGINLTQIQIDVITVEANDQEISKYLEDHGFIKKARLRGSDLVFIHANAQEKLQWFQDWAQNSQLRKYIRRGVYLFR
eukprot:392887_1